MLAARANREIVSNVGADALAHLPRMLGAEAKAAAAPGKRGNAHGLELADAAMGPDWATPERFRFGASGLYGVLVEIVAGTQPGERGDGAY